MLNIPGVFQRALKTPFLILNRESLFGGTSLGYGINVTGIKIDSTS